MVAIAEEVMDRHYRQRKEAASEMGVDEHRVSKMFAAKTLEDVRAKRGEHLSVQCLQRWSLRARQDLLVEWCRMHGLNVIRTEEQIHRDIIHEEFKLGEMFESVLKLRHLHQEQRETVDANRQKASELQAIPKRGVR